MAMMNVPWNDKAKHAAALKQGLAVLGPSFIAELCYACEGTGSYYVCEGIGSYRFKHCYSCGRDKPYGTALGLMQGMVPAPESVVNQVLVAGGKR